MGKRKTDQKQNRKRKNAAIANGTYSKRGKSDDMSKCKGQMIVWEKDRFGHSKATSCPLCNKSGQSVAKKLAEIKKK